MAGARPTLRRGDALMKPELTIQLMDTHAGGDVSRIVTGGIIDLPGDTVRAQMEYLRDNADGLRRLLLEEPYGIPEMSIDLLIPATNPEIGRASCRERV